MQTSRPRRAETNMPRTKEIPNAICCVWYSICDSIRGKNASRSFANKTRSETNICGWKEMSVANPYIFFEKRKEIKYISKKSRKRDLKCQRKTKAYGGIFISTTMFFPAEIKLSRVYAELRVGLPPLTSSTTLLATAVGYPRESISWTTLDALWRSSAARKARVMAS